MVKYLFEKYLEAGAGVSFKGQGLVWNTAEDVDPVVRAINECKSLKYLELEGNTLGPDAAKEIGKALESHPELEIALWKDMFTTRLKTEIPQALAFLFAGIDLAGAHLQRLDLSDNAIGPVAMPGLVPFFRTPSSYYIEELIVNNEGLGAEGGTTFSNALMECLELSQSSGERVLQLKVFQCGRNRQDNKGTMNWAKLFCAMGTLEEVHMPQNGINPIAIKALADAFRNNTNLRVINLEDNTVRYDGAEMLSEILPGLLKLEELNISDGLIKCDGAKHIGNGIRDLQQLRSVQLYSNEIKLEGGLVLASILRNLPSLSYVNLSNNEFGMAGVEQIEHLLSSVNEVIINDDEGEGGDGEEDGEVDDENKENEEEIDVENDHPELEVEKIDNRFQHIAAEVSPGVAETENEVGVKLQQDYEIAELFVRNPTIENYMKLLPKPAETLIPYFKHQTEYKSHDLCIYAAIHISKLMGPNTPKNFNALLKEALKETDANGFSTSLLICLGYMKPEKGEKSLISKPEVSTIKALSECLRSERVPFIVFRCIQHFVSQLASTDSFNILNSEYKNLLGVIKSRLSLCGGGYSPSTSPRVSL